jgi:VanZ family protein
MSGAVPQGAPASSPETMWKRLLWFVLLLIVYGSLYPWSFDFSRGAGIAPWRLLHWPGGWNLSVVRDAVVNILLYMPAGMSAALAFRSMGKRAVFAGAVLLCGAVSVCMEMLQVYVPGRDPSLADVLTNTAGGALGAAAGLLVHARLGRRAPLRAGVYDVRAAFLLALFVVWQAYPFFPIHGPYQLYAAITGFLHGAAAPVDIAVELAEWVSAILLLQAVSSYIRPWAPVIVLGILAGRILIAGRAPTPSEAIGAGVSVLLYLTVPARVRLRSALLLLAAAIAFRELAPFHFSNRATPFSWTPFAATFGAERTGAAIVVARKSFDYGAAVWLLRQRGAPLWRCALSVAAPLLALELVQTFLPGRIPEITDPLLAVGAAYIMAELERHAARSRREVSRDLSRIQVS